MEKAKILILLGSESDLPRVEDCLNFLNDMGVSFKIDISSAHRQPEKTIAHAKKAREEGFEVIIAFAGMAAHLPGVIASHTTLPVIGVPLSGGVLNGVDALLSIVQMPKGIPVATVGIDASKNAAILACKILGIKHKDIEKKIEKMKLDMKNQDRSISEKLKKYMKD
ncbi:MAG TPA: 5-(carboxyamino)imidazole ribonucleotide mutase [Syntrophorhabdaceae bacterium]|nr:5-(carboxyamino)imidazole ribonucleotide mutase [Syntrophorhabdaceae bacterium]HOT42192.1 5-(carboxyamino)imidazole ribonucleotide mutase [Syntrophorhabdaceae bacterium]HPC66861.1 5-(carboxyamino)imidazole ribonucleotide mutase [Syntrophorhabdaceae bacterium]HQE79323.1 5-(carboxyamino)imidazole ribonucleotide mutase [Syntrophorhabdaceae bacterium]HQH42976.1 5-(carboxyamino)imidazole ribonucleotide mutase [Syntrophorhabdaceae bacterium]